MGSLLPTALTHGNRSTFGGRICKVIEEVENLKICQPFTFQNFEEEIYFCLASNLAVRWYPFNVCEYCFCGAGIGDESDVCAKRAPLARGGVRPCDGTPHSLYCDTCDISYYCTTLWRYATFPLLWHVQCATYVGLLGCPTIHFVSGEIILKLLRFQKKYLPIQTCSLNVRYFLLLYDLVTGHAFLPRHSPLSPTCPIIDLGRAPYVLYGLNI